MTAFRRPSLRRSDPPHCCDVDSESTARIDLDRAIWGFSSETDEDVFAPRETGHRSLVRAIASGNEAAIEEEMGDVLFALVNLSRDERARWLGRPGGDQPNLSLEVLDCYWEEAKATEKSR